MSHMTHPSYAPDQGRSQEGLGPLQKILSRALAAVQIFSEGAPAPDALIPWKLFHTPSIVVSLLEIEELSKFHMYMYVLKSMHSWHKNVFINDDIKYFWH